MKGPPPEMIETSAGVAFKVDFHQPRAELSPFLGGINSYHTRVAPGVVHQEIFQPAWGCLRFQPYGDDWSMRYGAIDCRPVPRAAVFGPTSKAGVATVATGQLIQIDLLPRGWARLIDRSAFTLANRGVALETLLPELARTLSQRLREAEDFAAEAKALETIIGAAVLSAPAEPAEVAAIQEVLADRDTGRVEDAVQALGIPQWQFARIAKTYFGFTPKLLMRRARFMRTIMQIREQGAPDWSAIVDDAYTDQSHFIRDCRDFLDMTPGQFAARFQPIALAAFDEREAKVGDRHHLVSPTRR